MLGNMFLWLEANLKQGVIYFIKQALPPNKAAGSVSKLTEEIHVSRRASEQGSYAKPLLVQALSSHLRVWSAKSLSQLCKYKVISHVAVLCNHSLGHKAYITEKK